MYSDKWHGRSLARCRPKLPCHVETILSALTKPRVWVILTSSWRGGRVRLIAPVLKTGRSQDLAGSNPVLSVFQIGSLILIENGHEYA